MLIYLIIYLLIAFSGIFATRQISQTLALIFFFAFLLIFMGARFETGCDYGAYQGRFNSLYWSSDYLSYLGREEPGFHILNKIIHDFGLGYMWLNVASSLIFLAGLFRFLRLTPAPVFVLAILFPIIVVQLGMSGVRQALALSFLLHSFVAFVGLRRLESIIWVFIAAQFHQSAFIFLPIALMAGRQFNLKIAIASLAFLGPAAFFLLGERADVYTDRYIAQIYGEISSGGAVIRYLMVFIPCVLFEFYAKRVQAVFPELYPLLRIFSLVVFAMASLGLLSTVALHRMTYYVMPVALMILVCTVMVIPRAGLLSRKWFGLIAGAFAIYLVGWFVTSRHAASCFVPYQSFFT